MNKDTTKTTEMPALAQALIVLLNAHAECYKQNRTFRRVVSLVLGELFAVGRRTVTQGLLGLGIGGQDWSGWYRLFSLGRFDEEAAGRVMLRASLQHVDADEPYAVATDGVRIPRSSKTMPGTSWMLALGTLAFRPGLQRAQRFLHGAWLTPMVDGYCRAIALRFLPAFPEKAVAAEQVKACREWEAGLQFVRWVRSELDLAGRKEQMLLWLADASYDVLELWRGLPANCVLAVRTPRNRALYALPEKEARVGRPSIYGDKVLNPANWLKQRKSRIPITITVRGAPRTMHYQVEGPFIRDGLPECVLFLIVVGGFTRLVGKDKHKRHNVKPCFYLVNAVNKDGVWQLPLPIASILTWLWQRWELEVAHREMKSGLGVGEIQCWNKRSAVLSVQWSVWFYAILVFAGYRTWGVRQQPSAMGRWYRPKRWSISALQRSLRAAFQKDPEFRRRCLPLPDNWAVIDDWIAINTNAAASCSRL